MATTRVTPSGPWKRAIRTAAMPPEAMGSWRTYRPITRDEAAATAKRLSSPALALANRGDPRRTSPPSK